MSPRYWLPGGSLRADVASRSCIWFYPPSLCSRGAAFQVGRRPILSPQPTTGGSSSRVGAIRRRGYKSDYFQVLMSKYVVLFICSCFSISKYYISYIEVLRRTLRGATTEKCLCFRKHLLGKKRCPKQICAFGEGAPTNNLISPSSKERKGIHAHSTSFKSFISQSTLPIDVSTDFLVLFSQGGRCARQPPLPKRTALA